MSAETQVDVVLKSYVEAVDRGEAVALATVVKNQGVEGPPVGAKMAIWRDGRTEGTLGASDLGIAMIRKRFFDDLESVAAGNDPKGTIRDPEVAKCVPLPNGDANANRSMTKAEFMANPYFRARVTQDFRWHAGQPKDVRKAFLEAMGADEQIAKEGL